jgi:hypothetical protein
MSRGSHIDRAQTQIAPWLLGVNLHHDAFVRLDRNDEPHGPKIGRGFWGKRAMRHAAELDATGDRELLELGGSANYFMK